MSASINNRRGQAESLTKEHMLRNLKIIPAIGMGLASPRMQWNHASVKNAILKHGIRLFDLTPSFNRETQFGDILRDKDILNIPREEFFIMTKIQVPDYGQVAAACDRSLARLGIEYLDMFMVEWPDMGRGQGNPNARDQLWFEMEELYLSGLCKAIGVCNFHEKQLDQLLMNCRVWPHALQMEYNPLFNKKFTLEYCNRNSIALIAHTPLAQGQVLSNAKIYRIAALYGVDVAQIVLRWAMQKGLICIPSVMEEEHQAIDFDVWGFNLTNGDFWDIDLLNKKDCKLTRDPSRVI
eukprot:CFRG4201T1